MLIVSAIVHYNDIISELRPSKEELAAKAVEEEDRKAVTSTPTSTYLNCPSLYTHHAIPPNLSKLSLKEVERRFGKKSTAC